MAKKTPHMKPKPAKKHKPAKTPPPGEPSPAAAPASDQAPPEKPPAAPPGLDDDDDSKPRVHLELPHYPDAPFPAELEAVKVVPVPIDPEKAVPLAAPVKHERVFLKPWEPWFGGKYLLVTLPDGVSLPDGIPEQGEFADLTLTPPAGQ